METSANFIFVGILLIGAAQGQATLCCGGVTLHAGQQQAWPFSKQPWNVKGDVLVLDVGSLSYQGNHPAFPPFGEQGCADACARTPGCDAWTYCCKKEGCGSGCKAYTDKNPQLRPAMGTGDNPTIPNPAWKALSAITGFGPWGLTANCQYECDVSGSCKPGDMWPYGMCTLKKLPQPDTPDFWSTDVEQGWISGFTKQHPVQSSPVQYSDWPGATHSATREPQAHGRLCDYLAYQSFRSGLWATAITLPACHQFQ